MEDESSASSSPRPPEATQWGIVVQLRVDVVPGHLTARWINRRTGETEMEAVIRPIRDAVFPARQHLFECLTRWHQDGDLRLSDHCGAAGNSIRALCKRVENYGPSGDLEVTPYYCEDSTVSSPVWVPVPLKHPKAAWVWFCDLVAAYGKVLVNGEPTKKLTPERIALSAKALLPVLKSGGFATVPRKAPAKSAKRFYGLKVIQNMRNSRFEFHWLSLPEKAVVASGHVTVPDAYRLHWTLRNPASGGAEELVKIKQDEAAVVDQLNLWTRLFPLRADAFEAWTISRSMGTFEERRETPASVGQHIGQWIFHQILLLMEALGGARDRGRGKRGNIGPSLGRDAGPRSTAVLTAPAGKALPLSETRRTDASRQLVEAPAPKPAPRVPVPERAPPRPLPPIPVRLTSGKVSFGPALSPSRDLTEFLLREKAALWWVSNQADDLLCLPACRIKRLDYQVRTALRVLGPLRGRALLSDEVGLGKTIEAGLVISELLTRGMAKRVLVLTLPSLVDQWEEELDDKFNLKVVTSNQPALRADPESFWTQSTCVVASLHTVKLSTQLPIVIQQPWDIVVVDEAHHLRHQSSQAWKAVNAIPRQYLLLLTATPVQNTLEELYNLVTLLQPGHFPPPKEFKARYMDPERPRQPKNPDELRRLLGHVMIRNTRSNAGVALPPRQAETVLIEPSAREREEHLNWESEFRASLASLPNAQASLWGRLLLSALGSSPAAFQSCLRKYPDHKASERWRTRILFEEGWQTKCRLLLSLAQRETGVVVFTQFLDTQAALEAFLREKRLPVFAINGSTPAPRRQPLTEEFRKAGGALLLTHSGTEGRNLQFCNQLANIDLPWNPMEIEQRIGRLHRLGQTRPVQIHNFVQQGTLQQHLLEILQEKLNLFELVVGEVGLVLGDRFSGDEFEEELFRRWKAGEGKVGEAVAELGREILVARENYREVQKLDETLFSGDFEAL